jgi:hypothetical protein
MMLYLYSSHYSTIHNKLETSFEGSKRGIEFMYIHQEGESSITS